MTADAPVAKSVDAQDLNKIEPDRESGSVKPFKFGETPAPRSARQRRANPGNKRAGVETRRGGPKAAVSQGQGMVQTPNIDDGGESRSG